MMAWGHNPLSPWPLADPLLSQPQLMKVAKFNINNNHHKQIKLWIIRYPESDDITKAWML